MTNKIIVLSVVLCFLIGNAKGQYCTNDSRYSNASFFDSNEITVTKNIQFGVSVDRNNNPYTLKMDLYFPGLNIDPSPKRPFILLVHGGGFVSGDKQSGDIVDLCYHLAMRGFVCASINYRLGHNGTEYQKYKARYRAIQDGHAALRYIVNNANIARIDTNWIFVGGQSAGALTALGLVYADQQEMDSRSLLYSSIAIGADLGNLFSSGNNLTNSYSIKGIFNNWGNVPQYEVDIDEMVPTIAFHGELDQTVPIDSVISFNSILLGSRAIHNALIANDICSEINVVENAGHGVYRSSSSVFRAQRASCFFKSIFCANCNSLYTTDSIPSNCSLTVGYNEHIYDSNILKVYPNPYDNSFKIEGVEGTIELTIYNCFGNLVYKNEKIDGLIQIDLLSGVYFLNIRQLESNKTFNTKLIKI